jgi:AraC family transcriptional regulator of adaptative response/methylated-DNA-[protein]-cysteine methyltransferase
MATTNQLSFDIDGGITGTAINKSSVKERLRNTKWRQANIPLYLEKWEAADDSTPIYWQSAPTAVGEILVAATAKGVCFLGFNNDNHQETLDDLRMRFPHNPIEESATIWHEEVQRHLDNPRHELPVHLHLKGTDFQLSIWGKLLRIPFGGLTTYSELGDGARNARATGTAVGANPVSIIVPCHRVVRADGSYDGYYWGPELKKKLLVYEGI